MRSTGAGHTIAARRPMPLIYFIVMVGVLVFVHELGHFVSAKYFGVRVLKFSLGFGPRIAGFTRGGTEYVLSALPLGGYVRMLGETPRDEVAPRDQASSFATQAIWRRLIIVLGGPAMSLVFPILLYFVVFLGDTKLTPATIGSVLPDLPADGVLESGDRVLAVDGDEVSTFYELNRIVEASAGKTLRLTVERRGETLELDITPTAYIDRLRMLEIDERVGRIGVTPYFPSAVLEVSSAESPAAAARLRTFDVVVAAGGRPIDRYIDFEHQLAGNRGTLVPVTYLRPAPVPRALGGWANLDVYEPRVAALTPNPGKGEPRQRTGIGLADLYVSRVVTDSPEHRAGILPGDRLVELDGRPIRQWDGFLKDLEQSPGTEHVVTYQRAGQLREARYRLDARSGKLESGPLDCAGICNWVLGHTDPPVPNPHPLAYAFREAFQETAKVVQLTVYSVVRLLQGRLSTKTIGGPLTIFEAAGTAAKAGPLNYLTLMAFISLNLGMINLLPIPLLDGGHVPFLLYEAVARRPLAVKVREYAHIAGLVVLLALMVLAFKNDIERQWPSIVARVSGQ